jgi:hypothetical protein
MLLPRCHQTFDRLQYATGEVLELDPLPFWTHLPEEGRRGRIAALVADIEAEAAARRKKTGAQPLSVAAVLAQTRFGGLKGPRSLPLRPFTLPVKPSAASFEACTTDSWPPIAPPPRSSGLGLTRYSPIGSFPPALPFVGG